MGAGDLMRQRGFTLIELLVTMVVAIILMTVAVPGFQSMLAVNRMAADYNEVLSGLRFSRSEAIKRRKEVTFEVAASSPWSYKVMVNGVTDPIRVRSGRDGITSIDDEDFEVTFNALGKRESCIAGSGCSFNITSTSDYAEDHALSVNIVGRVSGG